MAYGFDPIMCELGQIIPPIGMNVFAMAAIARDIPLYHIFNGTLPLSYSFHGSNDYIGSLPAD